jgi:hypothetical protein
VRRHGCCVCGIFPSGFPIEFAHVRTGTDGGTGIKPSDWWGISLCSHHHRDQHLIGEPAFEATYCIDMKKLAMEFAKTSVDSAMRAAMKEAGL